MRRIIRMEMLLETAQADSSQIIGLGYVGYSGTVLLAGGEFCMKLKSLVAAGLLAVTALSASANEAGSSFASFVAGNNTWTWSFTLGEAGSLTANVFEYAKTEISGVSLLNSSNAVVFGTSWSSTLFPSDPVASIFSLSPIAVAAGDYSLVVTGKKKGEVFANYTLTTPVPEPETYAMMLAGLGAIGFMARRRQTK